MGGPAIAARSSFQAAGEAVAADETGAAFPAEAAILGAVEPRAAGKGYGECYQIQLMTLPGAVIPETPQALSGIVTHAGACYDPG
jgi:hypothetical protein